MTDFSTAVSEIINNSAIDLTTSLRRYAVDTGWDVLLASKISVTASGNTFKITAEDDEVAKKEYGDSDQDPSAAIRKWSYSRQPETALIKKFEATHGSLL